MTWDSLWTNVQLATMAGGGYGELHDAALAEQDGRIAWLGPQADLPRGAQAKEQHDGGGGWLTPGLIDCHTHIVYAGDRSGEFEARLNGASYEEIAKGGGGILSTVRATRAASEEALLAASLPRVRALMAEGVTTLEIKSGYGLELESERKMLRTAHRLERDLPLTVRTSFLGAHAVPPEFAGRADDYVDEICDRMLPALTAEGLVDAVDAFCETIGFTPLQTERVFDCARRFGLPVKLHAEQLSDQGGAELVARFGGLSADHLEYLSADGIAAMELAGTVAVLLPGAYYCLRETRLPPIVAMRDAGLRLAVATDSNPGTSPLTSILTAMNMACTLFRLTPQEALAGVTINAAHALGMQRETGSLEVGKRADLALWRIERPAELAYAIGLNPCIAVVHGGRVRDRSAAVT